MAPRHNPSRMTYFDGEPPPDAPPAPFTSGLSVTEYALLTQLSCVPLGQVLGASFHRTGWQSLPAQAQWGGELFCELALVAAAWNEARAQAFARLQENAGRAGADAVVGVRRHHGEHQWGRGTVDYVVTGTAIRIPGAGRDAGAGPGLCRRPGPALSGLRMADHRLLLERGWEPAELVGGSSAVFVSQSTGRRWRRRLTVASNQELGEYSLGFAAARRQAIEELRRQALAAGADGIVGLELRHDLQARSFPIARARSRQASGLSLTALAVGADTPAEGADRRDGIAITIHAVGTAIRRRIRTTRWAAATVVRL
jgi:uncharacterized protein YbjQ (UPF0145 family)